MIQAERQLIILDKLKQNPTLTTKKLAKELKVSEMTIRRDFNDLAKQGLIVREHGGAISAQIISRFTDQEMGIKLNINNETKNRIAKRASELINDGDCIFIDGGTTSLALIPYITEKKITIVTQSVLTLNNINKLKGELIILGGTFNQETSCTSGPICLENLQDFNFDLCFISCIAINVVNGSVSNTDTNNAQVKKYAMANSNTSVLLADSTKFNQNGFYRFAELSDFDYLITDYQDISDLEDITTIITVTT